MKKIFLFSFLSLLLFFSGCQEGSDNTSPSVGESSIDGSPPISFETGYSALKQEYKSNNDFQMCMTRSADACLQPLILKEIQAQNGDTSLCSDFILERSKEICQQNYHWQSAIDQRNLEICEKITNRDLKDQCKQEVQTQKAIDTKNPMECNALPEGGQRDACAQKAVFEIIKTDPDEKWCQSLSNVVADSCMNFLEER
jgi:hypothetical protein